MNHDDKELFDAQLISTLKDRVKELEDGLNRIAKQKTYDELLLDFSIDELEFDDAYDAIVQIARSILLPKESTDDNT